MRPYRQIPPETEDYRDEHWCREGTRQVETVVDAERFIERVGFPACLTDSRRPGPSLYVAVCGRRDTVMPRHVQKDPEASLAWRPSRGWTGVDRRDARRTHLSKRLES